MWANSAEIDTYSLNDGDLLICEGGDVCREAVFKWTNSETVIFQNSIHRVRSVDDNHPEWLLRLMQHVRSSGWIDVLCNKNTIVHFTSEKLSSLECPHPPPAEQAKILSTLRSETARIDALTAKTQCSIDLLKERRSAFITAAVTGQIDLRGEIA
jgi:type I restriction enzyme S subunit